MPDIIPTALQGAWRSLRDRQPASAVDAAVYVSRGSVATARRLPGSQLRLALRADPLDSSENLTGLLAAQLHSLGLKKRFGAWPINLVLAPEFYGLQLLEKPDVAADELRDAMRWKMQEDLKVEALCADVFELPPAATTAQPMVYTVAAPRASIAELAQAVSAAGVSIRCIDITELSLRNLSCLCFPQADQSVALLRLTANSGVVNLSRGYDLYLSRRISGVPSEFSDEAWGQFRDQLLLQVQRSVDFYESNLNQPACNMLIVGCTHFWTDEVTAFLDEMLHLPVRSLGSVLAGELEIVLHNPEPQHVDWQQLDMVQSNALAAVLPALGGVLRGSGFLEMVA